MARKVRDSSLDSREARSRLKARGKPYWRSIERGLHLGYRKLKGKAGTWWSRHYRGEREYDVRSIGAADDLSDADGIAILSYWHAVDAARKAMVDRAHAAAGKSTGPYLVSQAIEDYLAAKDRKSAYDIRKRCEAFILPALGHVAVKDLSTKAIRAWHVALANKPPRVRTRAGEKQNHRELSSDPEAIREAIRQRRSSANRAPTAITMR